MESLSSRLEDISENFFEVWRAWRYDQGWRLGPDAPDSKLSPHMVGSWSQLHETGRSWFRQHAALVILSIEQTGHKQTSPKVQSDKTVVRYKKRSTGGKLIPINL
jgi:hypothetical protein